MGDEDDLALVERSRDGDPEAFRTLVVRHQRKAYAVALGIVKDPDLAWDVAQEAFLRVHQHLADFKADASFSTWVLRITSNLSIDALRRERGSRRAALEDVPEAALAEGAEGVLATPLGVDPQETVLRRELAGRITEALASLPEAHRTILVLRELEGLSYEELAERLGIPRGTVMSRLFHARKKMQALLVEYAGRTPEGAGEGEAP
jgi:RNA polymerase sigma-70 factor (ECF subfamily)